MSFPSKKLRTGWDWFLILVIGIIFIALGIFLSALLSGCTVTPQVVKPTQASFDEGGQNSGLIGHDSYGFPIITMHALDRYNALIDRYGSRFTPPVKQNEGIFLTETNTAVMSWASEYYFATMNRWLKQEQPGWAK